MLAESNHVVGQNLRCNAPVVVTSFCELVCSPLHAVAFHITAEHIGVVHQVIRHGILEFLALLIVEERRHDCLQRKSLDGLECQRSLTRNLCAVRSIATSVTKQSVRVGTRLTGSQTTVCPQCRIDSRHLADIFVWRIVLVLALCVTDVHVESCAQLIINLEVVVTAEHITLETAAVDKSLHIVV